MGRYLDRFQWQGNEHVYTLPWLRNRLEYTADPERVKEFFREGQFTRSKLTRDMLTRFHLSHNSIVVSDDEHAQFLRKQFLERQPSSDRSQEIAQALMQSVLEHESNFEKSQTLHLSSALISKVYISLLTNLLGAEVLNPLKDYINTIDFRPGTRPMHLDGLMYAFGMQLPGFAPMRWIINLVFFKNDHYTRKITHKLEKLVFEYSIPKEGSWYSALLQMKESGEITKAQFRGELTSILVSSYALSAALSSMLLCLAARPEYVDRIARDDNLAKCFVNEVLRLYPPFRQFGYEEKGIWERTDRPKNEVTDFMVSVYGLHHNESVWENPEIFEPERFLSPDMTRGCKYLPFGMGKRSCTGRVYSIRILTEALKYICSDKCKTMIRLHENYQLSDTGLPLGVSGRLVSFPVDDRICIEKKRIDDCVLTQ